jgi:hypothetical protein
MKRFIVTISIIYNAIAICPALAIPLDRQVEEVVAHLVGIMDTTTQAKIKPQAPSVRMTTCKIQLLESDRDTSPSVYLYQEQALTKSLDKPYRQRFLKIFASLDGQNVESKSFKPLKTETWIGFCQKKESERLVSLQEFQDVGCSVFLKPVITIYIGQTQPGGCATKVKGAAKITNTVILHSQGMDTTDRGFDEQGKQVWGAVEDTYQFRWRKE